MLAQSDSDDMSAIELDVLESSAAALGAEQKQLTTQQKETQSGNGCPELAHYVSFELAA